MVNCSMWLVTILEELLTIVQPGQKYLGSLFFVAVETSCDYVRL